MRLLRSRIAQAGTYVPVRLAGRGGWRFAPPDAGGRYALSGSAAIKSALNCLLHALFGSIAIKIHVPFQPGYGELARLKGN